MECNGHEPSYNKKTFESSNVSNSGNFGTFWKLSKAKTIYISMPLQSYKIFLGTSWLEQTKSAQ